MTEYKFPDAIVSTKWLEDNLFAPNLRIFDCTTYLKYVSGSGRPYEIVDGRSDYNAAHIPGSGFLDLQGELSNQESPFLFTMPSVERLANAFSQLGVGDGLRVVLYSRQNPQWATRLWWMLRSIGFDNAAVLDGGWDKWELEGRPISAKALVFPPARLTTRPRPDVFVGKEVVLAAIGDQSVCVISALSPDLHSGENPRYGRSGRIPDSVNVPAASLLDPTNRTFLSAKATATNFDAVGAKPSKRIILYCGGGIWASLNAFLLHQLGYKKVTIYDNSMSQWAKDTTLPLEID